LDTLKEEPPLELKGFDNELEHSGLSIASIDALSENNESMEHIHTEISSLMDMLSEIDGFNVA
jgi:hypothetical protein